MSQTNTAAAMDSTAERSSKVQARLKTIYRKTVLPVEKRFQYDYFYESPFLSDVEFDCEFLSRKIQSFVCAFDSFVFFAVRLCFSATMRRTCLRIRDMLTMPNLICSMALGL
jgi:hypothetical protein